MSFANVFSQSVAYLFILLMLSFAEHKFVILMKSSVSIISFMDGAFSAVLKSHFCTESHLCFLLCYLVGDL